jgi:hypothetical protein
MSAARFDIGAVWVRQQDAPSQAQVFVYLPCQTCSQLRGSNMPVSARVHVRASASPEPSPESSDVSGTSTEHVGAAKVQTRKA